MLLPAIVVNGAADEPAGDFFDPPFGDIRRDLFHHPIGN
jgi:hypothetical protein